MPHNKDNFQILDNDITCLKSVQSLADYIFAVSLELVAITDVIENYATRALDWNERGDVLSDLTFDEVERICAASRSRKR
jgi:hypothetical protein